MQPRPYQRECATAVLDARDKGLQRVLYALPTGCGKTFVFTLIHRLWEAPGPTLVIAHREELLDQAAGAFLKVDPSLKVGVEQGDRRADPDCDVICGSVQTLSRGKRLLDFLPKMIVCDEAHHAPAASYKKIFERFGCFEPGGPMLVGCTATPKRLDRVNLATIFEKQVFNYPLRQAIEEGYLSDVRGYRVRSDVSLEKVKTTAGDFNQKELAEAVDDRIRTYKVLSHWWQVARNRQTIAFCASVEHAQNVCEAFRFGRVKAECIHGKLSREERESILSRFKRGEVQALTNVEILTEGFDHPPTSCILMMRPTQSWSLYMQMVGRGTRLYPGDPKSEVPFLQAPKEDLLVIDVVDNCRKHSLAGVPAILDLPADFDLEGKSLMQAAQFMDELGEKASIFTRGDLAQTPSSFDELETMLEQVDLFAQVEPPQEVRENCELTWVKMSPEKYYLSCGRDDQGLDREVKLEQDLMGNWILQLLVGGSLVYGTEYRSDDTPERLAKILKAADRGIRRVWPDAERIASQNAAWRTDPPTDKQLKMLRRFGYSDDLLLKLSKGEASNLITANLSAKR